MESPFSNLQHMESFDLLFFTGHGIVSNIIREAEEKEEGEGKFSHIGMVICGKDFPSSHRYHSQDIYVFESTLGGTLNDGVQNLRKKTRFGVQLRRLSEVIGAGGRGLWAPLHVQPAPRQVAAVVKKYEGIGYNADFCTLLAAVCDSEYLLCNKRLGFDGERLFCSELVARVFQDLGLLPIEVHPSLCTPVDFFIEPNGRPVGSSKGIPVLYKKIYKFGC